MKIKYLKPAPLGNTGDIGDVPDNQASVLIALGVAEAIDTGDDKTVKSVTTAKSKRKKDEPDLLSGGS